MTVRKVTTRKRPRVSVERGLLDGSELGLVRSLCPSVFASADDGAFAKPEIDLAILSTQQSAYGKHRLFLHQDWGGNASGEVSRIGDGEVPHFEEAVRQLERAINDAIGTEIALPHGHRQGSSRHDFALALGGQPAYVLTQQHNGAWYLYLPSLADTRVWLRSFLCFLNDEDPRAVPAAPPKIAAAVDWFTSDERRIAADVGRLEGELIEAKQRLEDARTQLELVTSMVDQKERAVLFLNGEELVQRVISLLSNLGFVVTNVDETLEKSEPKREDLRIEHPELPDWVAIAEVKGYENGPKTNDLRQLNEQAKRFIKREGQPPDAVWWIVNPYRRIDPSDRPALNNAVLTAAELIDANVHSVTDLYQYVHSAAECNVIESFNLSTP